jgi:hypothetical protein
MEEANIAHPKQARKVRSSFKVMPVVFFDGEGIFHKFIHRDKL